MEVPGMKRKGNAGWSKMAFKGEWAKTLQKYLEKKQDSVPHGWLKADDALNKMGYSGNSSGQRNKLLNQMAKEGVLLKKNFRIFDASGRRISSITHYKLSSLL
jgi:hypothetical protein